jgi:hypothetical protein
MDDGDAAARQQGLQQFLEVTPARGHLGAGRTCTAGGRMYRSKRGKQRSQTACDRGRRQRSHVCAWTLDLSDDAAALAQLRAAARSSDVDA